MLSRRLRSAMPRTTALSSLYLSPLTTTRRISFRYKPAQLDATNHNRIAARITQDSCSTPRYLSTSAQLSAVSFRDLKSEDKDEEPKSPKEKSVKKETEDNAAEEAYRRATKGSFAKAQAEREKERRRIEEAEAEAKRQEESGEGEDGSEHDVGGKNDKSKKAKSEKAEAPPPFGNKSPWEVFTETLRSEVKASKEWNESTKQLASSAHQFSENESLKKARAAYDAASGAAASGTASALKSTGRVVGQGAAWTWDSAPLRGVRSGAGALGRGLDKATKPIRDTEAFKSVKNVVDDGSSSRYGGWVEKEERRRRREERAAREASGQSGSGRSPENMEEDPNAGTNISLHKDSKFNERWREFRDTSPLMQSIFSLKSSYNESENPLVSTARSITDRVAGFFAENETALVIKKFKEMDPSFSIEPFLRDMREYILPEVLDAYVRGDTETLKLWLSAAQYQVYAALANQYRSNGLKSDGQILDIRNVDILSARKLEPGEIPVFIITCRTQEVHVYRNAKTGVLAAGMEDKVQQVTYAIGITRIPEDVNNPDTRGWRLIELQKSARDYI